jgi:malate dehydrogenase (quinone)
MTPSPGGTSCLENAELDLRTIAQHLGANIDETALQEDLLADNQKHDSEDFSGVLITGNDVS